MLLAPSPGYGACGYNWGGALGVTCWSNSYKGTYYDSVVVVPLLGVEELCDIVWTLCSLAVHDLLILGRGWDYQRYEAWLAAVLTRELLGGEPIPA